MFFSIYDHLGFALQTKESEVLGVFIYIYIYGVSLGPDSFVSWRSYSMFSKRLVGSKYSKRASWHSEAKYGSLQAYPSSPIQNVFFGGS